MPSLLLEPGDLAIRTDGNAVSSAAILDAGSAEDSP